MFEIVLTKVDADITACYEQRPIEPNSSIQKLTESFCRRLHHIRELVLRITDQKRNIRTNTTTCLYYFFT